MRVGFWIGIQLVVVAIASLPFWVSFTKPRESILLEHARLVSAEPEEIRLPDDWHLRHEKGPAVTYEFALEIERVPEQPWALLLTSVRTRTVVSLNGQRLTHHENNQNLADARFWFRPLLYSVPASLLRSGENHLRIDLSADAGRGYLAAPLTGPHTALARFASQHRLWRQSLLQTIVVAMIAVALLMLVLWAQRPGDVVYGFYGVGMLSWALHDLHFIVIHPFLPGRYWDATSYAALGGFIIATVFFIHRYLGFQRRQIERAAIWFAVISVPVMLASPARIFYAYSAYVWHPAIMALGFYLFVSMYREAWHRNSAELHLLAMTGSVMVLYGGHDLLIMLGLQPWGNGFLLPYSAAPSLIIFSSMLVNRFAGNLDKMESLTRDLDKRVKVAAREIEANLVRLRDLEREKLLSTERERVGRDIHDGVGGQLVALLSRIKTGRHSAEEVETALSHAMQDLRLVIESLDIPEGDLGTALATWRHRLERRLGDDSEVKLVWKPSDIIPLAGFGPSEILNLLRLLDEAATNAIRHSGASTIAVEFGIRDGRHYICLSDDGIGGAHSTTDGRGIPNIYRRAESLGATLKIVSDAQGTTVRLWLAAGD